MADTKADLRASSEHGFPIGDGIILVGIHQPDACVGEHCVIHNPSDHHMRSWKMRWREDKGMLERICPDHGLGHPDPDSLAYEIRAGRAYQGVHGCCGCC